MVTDGDAATLSGYPVEVLRQWLAASCEAQGVPVVVRDPRIVSDVAVLLGGVRGGGRARAGAPVPGNGRALPPAIAS